MRAHEMAASRGAGQTFFALVCLPLLAALVLVIALAGTALGADVTVDTTTDEWTNNGTCSIREALNAVRRGQNFRGCVGDTSTNGWGTNDTIFIPLGTYTLTRAGGESRRNNDLDVEADVTLFGGGGSGGGTIISANNNYEVIEVFAGNTVEFADISIEDGASSTDYHGSGIHNNGTLTLTRVNVVNNTGTGNAVGGIGNDGTLVISGSSISLNSNASAVVGAGIDNNGAAMTITTSTVSGNIGPGPGVYHYDDGTAPLSVVFSTFANNGTGYGSNTTAGAFSNTIVNDGCATNVADGGYNTDAGAGCGLSAGTSQSSTSIGLAALGFYGGPTLTHAIDNNDTAVYDQIPSGTNGCGTTYTLDQRTGVRPSPALGSCDIGSFEYDASFTVAVVSSFKAYRDGAGTVVEWTTASEIGTAGFHLERFDRSTGAYTAVGTGFIPSVRADQGGTYRHSDPAALPGETYRYRLVEIGKMGRQVHGPFDITVGSGAGERAAAASAADGVSAGEARKPDAARERGARQRLAGRRLEAERLSSLRTGRYVKIGVREDGLYHVDAAAIGTAAGVGAGRISGLIGSGSLALSSGGSAVPWVAAPGNGGLYFYGQGIDTPHTTDNVYIIEQGSGLPMPIVDGRPPAPASFDSYFLQSTHVEQDDIVYSAYAEDQNEDYWYMNEIFAVAGFDTAVVTAPAADVVDTIGATLTVNLRGIVLPGFTESFRIDVEVNGVSLGTKTWTETDVVPQQFAIDPGVLVDGANTVTIKAVDGPDLLPSWVVVDSVDIDYYREYRAGGGTELAFPANRGSIVAVRGFAGPNVVTLDITDPAAPLFVRNTTLSRMDGYGVGITPSSSDARYLAILPSAAKSPAWLTAGSTLPSRATVADVEYLIVTTPALVSDAKGLAQLRKAKGLTTAVVTIDAVYDAFNHGIASPTALKDFLAWVYGEGKGTLRYVVLAGEGSIDYRDLKGNGDSMVPPWLSATPHGLFVSDISYGDTNGDGVPEFIVARLPVDSGTELAAYTQKVAAHEAAPESSVLMLSDNADGAGDFPATSNEMAALIPATVPLASVTLEGTPLATARADMVAALQAGTGLVNYIGHGGIDKLAAEGLLTTLDVPGLGNTGKYPVFLALSCVINRYGLPGIDSLGEDLVLSPDSGAIAVYGPAGLSQSSGADVMNESLLGVIYGRGDGVLGDAVGRALYRFAGSGISDYMLGTYNIVGDPVVEIDLP